MVDQGVDDWDKPVRDYLPGFRMYDPVATDEMTPRDLVTHRSGLPRHDLVWYGSSFSQKEIVERLRYLEPNKPLRQTFQYNNLMFITAGYLESVLNQSSWEEAVQKLVLTPIGMTGTLLTAAFPGSPVRPLEPKHGTIFNLPSLPGTTIEFKKDESGKFSQLVFANTDISYLLKRK